MAKKKTQKTFYGVAVVDRHRDRVLSIRPYPDYDTANMAMSALSEAMDSLFGKESEILRDISICCFPWEEGQAIDPKSYDDLPARTIRNMHVLR